jgi:hypothetical protein
MDELTQVFNNTKIGVSNEDSLMATPPKSNPKRKL